MVIAIIMGFSPHNGEVILKLSKEMRVVHSRQVSVPALVDVNSAVHYLRTDLCPYAKGYRHFACPRNGEIILKIIAFGLK